MREVSLRFVFPEGKPMVGLWGNWELPSIGKVSKVIWRDTLAEIEVDPKFQELLEAIPLYCELSEQTIVLHRSHSLEPRLKELLQESGFDKSHPDAHLAWKTFVRFLAEPMQLRMDETVFLELGTDDKVGFLHLIWQNS